VNCDCLLITTVALIHSQLVGYPDATAAEAN